MKKVITLFAAIFLLGTILACKNQAEQTSEWNSITNKNDVVGTWEGSASDQGFVGTQTIVVNADYSGTIEIIYDYSSITVMSIDDFESTFDTTTKPSMEAVFDTVSIDKTSKKITAMLSFTPGDFDSMLADLQISADKKRILMDDGAGNTVILYKK